MKQLVLSLLMTCLFTALIHAQRDYSKVVIKAQQLTDQIYMLEGAGGNIGVMVGDDGVFMIDSQFAPLSDKIKEAISKLSNKPIIYLANTHWHGDHTGGNAAFATEGAQIIAHENVRMRKSTDQFSKAFNRTTPAAPKATWPVITFSDDIKVYLNDQEVALLHVHNAHTDGDAFVYFTQSNVMHMGDTFFNGRFPYVDLGSGGSVKGLIAAISKALMIVDEDTQIIPGHGALANKADLLKYQEVVTTVVAKVESAIAKNMSLADIKAAGYTTAYEGWGSGFISDEKFIDTIWTDLTREEP